VKTIDQKDPAVSEQIPRDPNGQRKCNYQIESVSCNGGIHLGFFIVFVFVYFDISGNSEKSLQKNY
jgi:hypothetical protein